MKNNFQSKSVPRGTRTIWRYLSALILLFSLSIGQMWAADPTPASAGTYTINGKKPGGENKFYKLGDGVYIHRRNNSSWTDGSGMKTTNTNTNGVAVYLSSSMNMSGLIKKSSSKNEVTVQFDVYTLSNGATALNSMVNGTDNSTTVSVTLSSSPTYTSSVTFAALSSNAAEEKSSPNLTLAAGYYYIVPHETANIGKTFIYSITLSAVTPSCSAPDAPTISGTTSYTEGQTIELTASCASGADASTTYTWYEGADWATASAASPVQAAAVAGDGGNVFTKTAALADNGKIYWCEAANSTCVAHSAAGTEIAVAASAAAKHDITYTNTKGADNSANPTQYTEGIGVASFEPLTDVTDFHFTGWSPASIANDATTDQTIDAQWVAAYNVTFSAGAGSGTVPASFQKWEGGKFNLPGQGSMTHATKVFDGWKANGAGDKLAADAEYTMGAAAVEFVAQWKSAPVVLFHYQQSNLSANLAAGTYSATGGTLTTSAQMSKESATYNAAVDADMKGGNNVGKLGSNAAYIQLTLSSGNFEEGDIVYVCGYNPYKISTTTGLSGDIAASVATGTAKGDYNVGSAVIPAGVEQGSIYLNRANGTGTGFAAVKVVRVVKDIISTVNTLTDVKVGESSISAANLATLVSEHSLALSDALASAPTITFNQHTVITYEDYSTKTSDTPIPVVASDNGAGKWTASATIDAVTYTVTLNIASGHSVIYDANGGSGTMTDANLYAEGQEVTVLANEFTAPAANQKFNGWSSSPSVTISEGKFNMPASDVTLSAQWKEFFTITYMDGAAPLGTEDVFVGDAPVGLSPAPTKPLFSFAGWKDELDVDVDVTTLTAAATVYAKWNKAYASSVDLEGLVEAEGTGADWQAYMSSHNFAFSTSNVSLDAKASGKTYDNWPYQGLKMKSNGAYVEGNIHDDQLVIIKLGHMAAAANVSIDGVAAGTATGLDAAEPAGQLNYFYVANEAVLRYQTTDGNACILKAITITNPFQVTFNANGGEPVASQYGHPAVTLPDASNGTKSLLGWFDAAEGGNKIGDVGESYTPAADIELFAQWEDVSTDARLASITLDPSTGVWEPAFNPEIVNYTYTMPYPTAAVPQITGATAVNAGGSYSIVSQASAWDETAVIRGVAASSDTKAYNITMKIAPKDGVSIIKVATTGGTNKTVTGLYAGDGDVNLSSGKKMDNGKYIGFTLDGTTLQAGDQINVHTTTAANTEGSHIIFYDNMTDKNELYETGEIGGTGDNIFEINAAMIGATTAYVYRSNADAAHQWNGYVDFIEVTRAMNPVLTAITIDGRVGEINEALKTVAVTIPYEADLAALTVVPTIVWNGAHATTPTQVISNGGDWVLVADGSNTYRIMDKDGDYTDYTITLTRDVKKYTVTYYDGSTVLGTEDVEDGNHPTATGITVPVKFGSTFAGWSESDGGAVVELSDITISAAKDLFAKYEVIPCPTSGTVYKFEIKDGLASENLPIATDMDMSSYIDATGIGLLTYSATANNKATINSDGTIQLKDATAAYLKVELACALAAGDQIRAHVSNNPIRVQVGTTYDSSKDLILDKNAYDIVDITAAMEGLKVLYIARSTNGNANLADFEIYRRPALTGASLADLTMRQGQNKTPELTLEPSADAIVTSQVWEIVGEPTNLTGAAINGTTGVITTGTLNNPANNGTISVKVTLNGGSIEATCTVTVVDAIVQADVTKSTVWNWQNTGAAANIQLTNSSDPKKNENFVLANVAVNNNANFESDKLVVEGEYMVRDYNAANPYFQGQLIQFHTTVAGVVRVKFSHTGSNKPARELFVNGVGTGDTRTQATGEWSRYVEVPAGDVSLTAFHVDPADGAGQQYIRIFEIEFLEIIDSRTEYAAKDLGTACYEYDAVVIGATPYMVAGVNGNGYIVFDEITSGVIDAGYPYLFEAAGGKVFFCKPVGTTAAPLVSGEETSVKGMIGTFSGTTLTQGEDDICYFAGRHIWRVNDFSVDIDVDPHRCYVNYDVLRTKPAAAAAPGRRRVIMGVNGKDEAQGFENLESGDAPMKIMIDGTLYILRGEKVFDATGRLVK